MRRRSGLSSSPIEFLHKRFYLVVVRERTACSIHRTKDQTGDSLTTLERHHFPRTSGIHFVSLQEQLQPCSSTRDFVLGIPQTIRFTSFLIDFMTATTSPLNENFTQVATGEYTRGGPEKVHYFVLRRRHLRQEIQAIHLICRWRLLYLQLPPHEALAPFEHLPYISSSFLSSSDPFDPPNIQVSLMGIAKGLERELLGSTRSNLATIATESEKEPSIWTISRRFIVYNSVLGRHRYTTNRPNCDDINSEEQCMGFGSAIAALKRRKVSLVVTLSTATSTDTNAACGLEMLNVSDSISLENQLAPSDKIQINRFLEVCETTEGIIAVDGSSESGNVSAATCIGCYLMKHSKFTSEEVIGWLHFCLPVKISFAWKFFLRKMRMWLEGERYRRARKGDRSDHLTNSSTLASTRINIGNISLGRLSLLGTRDREKNHFDSYMANIPVSICLSSRLQESQPSPTAATTTAQLKRRPLTQGSTGNRRYHRNTDGTSLRADFAIMHKFLHQTPTVSPRSTANSPAGNHSVPSRPKASPGPAATPTTCTEALA